VTSSQNVSKHKIRYFRYL